MLKPRLLIFVNNSLARLSPDKPHLQYKKIKKSSLTSQLSSTKCKTNESCSLLEQSAASSAITGKKNLLHLLFSQLWPDRNNWSDHSEYF